MNRVLWLCAFGVLVSAARAQDEQAPGVAVEAKPPAPVHPRVNIETDHGLIVIELDAEKAPKTVANFLNYVDQKYYDGTIFHRVIANFMIQGGGYTALDVPKPSPLHDTPVDNEGNNGLKNIRGSIAMARSKNPNSATSQFFINVVDNPKLDYPSPDGSGYAVFGRVIEGMDDVVERIRNVECVENPKRPDDKKSVPLAPPRILTATRVEPRDVTTQAGDAPADPPRRPETSDGANP
jgi:peptidyl-prolyl cis-trans isomerase A (cyclophilin A)